MKRNWFFLVWLVFFHFAAHSQNTLDEFLDYALKNNPVILAQKNNLKLNALDSSLFRSTLKTQITSQNEGLYYPIVKGVGYDEIITNGQQIGLLINFDKQVLFKGQLTANLNAFGISQDIARNSLKLSEKDLIRTITDLYLTAWGDYLQWQYNSEVLLLYSNEDTVVRSLTQANIYNQSDYMVFLTVYHRQRLATGNALLQYKSDLVNLRYESGIRDTAMIYLQDPHLKQYDIEPDQPSVFFRQFSLDSLRLRNESELIHASYQPRFQLHADAGYLSSLAVTPYKNFGVGAGMSLLIPIYDGRALQLKINKVQVQQDNLISQKLFFQNKYDLQTRQVRSMINDLEMQNKEITDQLGFYDRLIEADKKLIAAGQLDILQYFVVVQNYLDLKNQETINHIKISMLINQFNYLAN
jgi:hypothetical protein